MHERNASESHSFIDNLSFPSWQMYNINGLQKVADILLENPSWTIAHLIANFNLIEYIGHPKVTDLIDEADYATNMTPIQVSWAQQHMLTEINHFPLLCYLSVFHSGTQFVR